MAENQGSKETQPVVRKTSVMSTMESPETRTGVTAGHEVALMDTQSDVTKTSTKSIAETTTTGTTENKVPPSGLHPELQNLYDSECEWDCEMLFQ
ncbi:hypothetical protein IV203_015089 [Nitzschia inconspicua]|uniref:Uncharacterized protein n=1 Tax=Nitzschia inconspicua TaxID=303405 RepID=A0A9K3LB40_9STRA|nr:hypothetical protein IV203_015089 [Nitzschia inconspicua]